VGIMVNFGTGGRRRTPALARVRLRPRLPRLSPQRLLIACLVAVVAAASLVVYLERRAAALQQARTDMVMRQVCERTADALVTRTNELLGAAVLSTIEAIGHREIERYNLARVDALLASGLQEHSYVGRFFFWHERMPARFARQLMFYRPPGEAGPRHVTGTGPEAAGGAFFADPDRSAVLWERAARLARAGESFAVEEVEIGGAPHQAVYHYMWSSAQRTTIFSIVGFVVNLDELRATRFSRLAARGLEPLLNPGGDLPRLALRIEDAAGRRIAGADHGEPGLPSAEERFELLFFPKRELGNYLAPLPALATWRLIVRPEAALPDGSPSGLWLLSAVVLLLVIAVVCAVGVNREAQRLSQLQADFVMNVSHQLRTPLAMLSGAAETLGLERLRSPEKIKAYAEIVQAQSRRLSALVDQILHFHTADQADHTAAWQRIDLGALVTRAAGDVRVLADRIPIAIDVEAPVRPLAVYGDPVALEHVVLNLLENAVKYGAGDGDAVSVIVEAVDRRAVVRVADRGVGIARAELPHIFEKFYRGRVDGPTRRGFGLGLAIVRSTVVAHGGTIDVQSEPGRGSVFTIALPLAA
jgi:signal transduction histidine kinase